MTLLETLYKHLRYNDLTANAEHFSTHYLNKSRSWYAVQTHEGRDFSTSAAIHCLRTIRLFSNEPALSNEQKKALETAEQRLSNHLFEKNRIITIADCK